MLMLIIYLPCASGMADHLLCADTSTGMAEMCYATTDLRMRRREWCKFKTNQVLPLASCLSSLETSLT